MFIIGLSFLVGWFQGMGWPPCGRVMTHWFSQNERGTKMSIWNVRPQRRRRHWSARWPPTRHLLSARVRGRYGYVLSLLFPAVVAIVVAMLAFRADPRHAPVVPGSRPSRNTATTTRKITARSRSRSLRRRKSSSNTYSTTRYSGIIAFANAFVYLVRYGVLDWAPTYLQDIKGYDIKDVGLGLLAHTNAQPSPARSSADGCRTRSSKDAGPSRP